MVRTGAARADSSTWVRRAERRLQLVDRAADLVRDRGLDAVTMENLAAAADINKAVVYRAFPNRSAVLLALFEREVAVMTLAVERAIAAGATLEASLPNVVHIWFDAVEHTGDLLVEMLTGPSTDAALVERRVRWHHDAVDAWTSAVHSATGVPVAEAADAVAIVLAGLHGAVARWRVDRRPRARVEERFLRIALAALRDLSPSQTVFGRGA